MPYYMYVSARGTTKLCGLPWIPPRETLEPQGAVAVSGGPAPIAVDPSRRFLYVAKRGERKIASFRIDQGTGGLTLLGTVDLLNDPCYLATDRRGKFLLASYYEGRGVSVHSIGDDGAVERSAC